MIKFLASIPLAVLTTCWGGYVLTVLWAWFVVPVFHAPALRIPYAIGLAIVVGMLTHQHKYSKDEDNVAWWEHAVYSLVVSTLALLIGWIVTWFV